VLIWIVCVIPVAVANLMLHTPVRVVRMLIRIAFVTMVEGSRSVLVPVVAAARIWIVFVTAG
jgi:hypothetical protein